MADTVVLMKNRVLDMAMRGELVDQLPEEGSAEELILPFKKENKLKEINKDEIPYTIPQSWLWVDFESIIKSIGTKNNQIKSKEIENTGTIPVVSQGKEYIDGFSNQVDKSISPKKPVILFGDHTRNVKYIDFEFIIGADGTKIFESLLADSKYFFRWVQRASKFIENRGYSRHYSLLKKNPVPIPPMAEQKRIVAKIEEIFGVIDQIGTKKEEALTIINNMRKTTLQDAIMGVLVDQDETDKPTSDLYEQIQSEKKHLIKSGEIKKEKALPEIEANEYPFEIPESWKWVRFNSILDIRDGTHDTPKYHKEGIPLITSKNLKSGDIDFTNVKYISEDNHIKISERSKVDNGDILFAMIGTIGNPVLVNTETEFSIKNVALFKNYPNKNVETKYILYFLKAIERQLKEEASGAVQSFLSLTYLRKLLIPLPPIAEQHRIVEKLDEIMGICDQMEAIFDGSSEMNTNLNVV